MSSQGKKAGGVLDRHDFANFWEQDSPTLLSVLPATSVVLVRIRGVTTTFGRFRPPFADGLSFLLL
jgi:hypothetical protein